MEMYRKFLPTPHKTTTTFVVLAEMTWNFQKISPTKFGSYKIEMGAYGAHFGVENLRFLGVRVNLPP